MATIATSQAAESVGHLQEEALRRKERLRQLRKRSHDQKVETLQGCLDDDSLPKPVFRNYKPQSEDLKASELPKPDLVDLTPHVQEQIDSGKAQSVLDEVNLTSLAPRKPDWDLKRSVDKRLKKLEKRTQRSIAELIRERLQEENNDLASAVNQAPVGN